MFSMMLASLPNDIIHIILSKLDIEDIIHLYRTNLDIRKLFDDIYFINNLSLIRINTYANNFTEFLELYNQQNITYHSLKYFSLEECFRLSAASELKYINFFKELGANNFDDFFIHACEIGNLSTVKLAINFLCNVKRFEKNIIDKGIIATSKAGNLLIFKELQLYTDFSYIFDSIIDNSIKYNNINIIEDFVNNGNLDQMKINILLLYAIKNNNLLIIDYLLEFYKYSDNIIVLLCICYGSLSTFKYLVIDENGEKNRLSCINDNLIYEIITNKRNDIIKYLQENKLFIFDQFHLDMMLFLSCKHNNSELIKFALQNGSKLYIAAISYGLSNNNYEIVDIVLNFDDVYTHEMTEDYIVKITLGDRNQVVTPGILDTALKSLYSVYSRPVSYNTLLFYGAIKGDKSIIDKALYNGADSYKKAIYEAYKNGNSEIISYLKDRYGESLKLDISESFNKLSNLFNI